MASRTFFLCNGYLASTTSISANLLLIYLIKKKAPKELLPYSGLMLKTCIIDLIYSVLYFVGQQQIIIHEDTFVLHFNGLLESIPMLPNFILNIFSLFILYFGFCATPITFIFRYLYICKATLFSTPKLLLLYTGSLLLTLVHTSFGAAAWFPTHALNRIPVIFITEKNNMTFLTMTAYSLFLKFLVYSIVIWCHSQVSSVLKSSDKHCIDDDKKQAEMQLSKALIVHALTPIATCLLVLGTILSIFTNLPIEQIAPWVSMLSAWMPAVNPLAVILCIEAYRKRLFCRFSSISKKEVANERSIKYSINRAQIDV